MIGFCEECGERYFFEIKNIKGNLHSFKCKSCGYLITISKEKPTEIIPPSSALLAKIQEQEPRKKSNKIRVLVVDDSKLFRHILIRIIESDGTVEVVGEAANGKEAIKLNRSLQPDLITLDVNMPVMDGSTTLKHFMLSNPCPVVIVSSLSNRTQNAIIDFLRIGAVGFLIKPGSKEDPEKTRKRFNKTIQLASRAKIVNFQHLRAPKAMKTQVKPAGSRAPCEQLTLMLSGTGGYAELFKVFDRLPSGFEGTIVALQTMPAELTKHLVAYIGQICRIPVLPLRSTTQLLAGHCYIGSDNTTLELEERQDGFYLKEQEPLSDSPFLKKHFSGDLLRSVADRFSGRRLLVLLSGADPGLLDNLRHFRDKKGQIIIQKPSTCMLSEEIEKVEQAGLTNTSAVSGKMVEVIVEQLSLSCVALAGSKKNRISSDFSQKRNFQRIFFTIVTGPRIDLMASEESGETITAVVVNLSENGLGLVVNRNQSPLLLQKGQQVTIKNITGDPNLAFLTGEKLVVRWIIDQPLRDNNEFGCVLVDLPNSTRQHLREIVDAALLAHNEEYHGHSYVK